MLSVDTFLDAASTGIFIRGIETLVPDRARKTLARVVRLTLYATMDASPDGVTPSSFSLGKIEYSYLMGRQNQIFDLSREAVDARALDAKFALFERICPLWKDTAPMVLCRYLAHTKGRDEYKQVPATDPLFQYHLGRLGMRLWLSARERDSSPDCAQIAQSMSQRLEEVLAPVHEAPDAHYL